MKQQRIGLLILAIVAVIIGVYVLRTRHTATQSAVSGQTGISITPITVKGYVGGEKLGFLADPQVIKILNDKYGITVDGTKLGSIDMVSRPTDGQDFLWPSSQVALDLYKSKGGKFSKADIVFNSPIVLYSWDFITDALIKQKIVQKQGAEFYIVDMPKAIQFVNKGTKWKDIGLPQLYGKMSIRSTDPTKSNSGMMFAGLLANVTNNGDVVDDTSVQKTLPIVKTFFTRLGYLDESSGDLFDQFLKMGEGANPIIVGYESQLVEFTIEHPEYRDMLRQRIRILYPQPTVWSSHPLIALNSNGERFLAACKDPQIQKIAWEQHGFRSGLLGAQNDPKVLQVIGIPATIQNVIPMPTGRVMQRIIDDLNAK